jgi:hypothetical protein
MTCQARILLSSGLEGPVEIMRAGSRLPTWSIVSDALFSDGSGFTNA